MAAAGTASISLDVNILSTSKHPNVPRNKNHRLASPSALPLSLLSRSTSLRDLQQIHALVIKTNTQKDIAVISQLINFCTRRSSTASMVYAQQLFDTISQPDVVLFNTMARGYASTNDPLEAFYLFARILELGISPDSYTFPSLIKACANAKSLEEGKQTHCVAVKHGLHENEYVCPTLINMYAECGDVSAARRIFDRVDVPCVVSYNSIITACARSSRPGEALALFREMQADSLQPTYVTMLSVLSSCALMGSLELGKWIHEYVKKSGFDSLVKVNTALIDMYAKCGSLEDAVLVFRKMVSRDTQAWSAMIMAYAIHGRGDMAIPLFDEMEENGIKPDAVTFLGILYACSHSGLVDRGLSYFYSMRDVYHIVPRVKQFGCVVDLLARAGRLDEAYAFVDSLPIKPTPILWRTLLSACGGHGNVELGKRVFERICVLDDSHGGDYVILSNLCAHSGRWDDVNYIRKLMKDRGVVKVPGCSSIEINNTVHEFFAGDAHHPQSAELRKMLDEVLEQLRLVGYVPDVSQVYHLGMGQKEKEVSLRYHSEKLAIAFGLINTPPGTIIRVVKNLRVCTDCHSAAKLMSMVFDRQIILRDLNRFHHFKNGECSCKDYW